MDRVCLHYECPYRNSLGYCSVTACCNYKVSNKVTESTTSYSPTVVFKPVTNADRIRAMSNEELAEFLHWGHCPSPEYFEDCPRYRDEVPDCHKCWREWLKEEAKDE